MSKLTDAALRRAKPRANSYKLTDAERRGRGRLMCRIDTSGSKDFFFRYRAQGADRLIKIGRYDPDGRTGCFTLAQAIEKAREFGERLKVTPDLKEAMAIDARHAKAQRRAELVNIDAADHQTLRALLAMYVAFLRREKKSAVRDVEGIFARHVIEAFPNLADMQAADVQARDIATLMRTLIDAGKARTAGKLRSYVSAAYALALRAESDPKVPADALAFRLPANPAAATRAHSGVKARSRTLTESELRQYMEHVTGISDAQRDALALLLLLGGQRPAQLLRATVRDADLSSRRLTIYDPKGNRTEPRPHVLPLDGVAHEIVARRIVVADELKTDWLFSTDGRAALRLETLSGTVKGISDGMVQAKQSRSGFQLRDVRRTCETMLAGMGVSRDVRAQLLSHGLGGVQALHYDRHDYMEEKKRALQRWHDRLDEIRTGESSPRVVPFRTKA
jgi:integrase